MRKSIKVTVIALTAAILTGGTLYMCRPKENTEVPDNAITESIPTDVKVDIRKTQEDIPEYREITDEETGETVIAEVQKNEPPPKTKPPAVICRRFYGFIGDRLICKSDNTKTEKVYNSII